MRLGEGSLDYYRIETGRSLRLIAEDDHHISAAEMISGKDRLYCPDWWDWWDVKEETPYRGASLSETHPHPETR